MISALHLARTVAQRFGLDVQRYPASDPLRPVALLLRDYDVVLDVGANDGGYATAIRRLGYGGRIVSFEPLSQPYARLAAKAAGDPRWETRQVALGAAREQVTVNVAGNAAASSSVLPMLDTHVRAAPTSAYVGAERVEQVTLDDVLAETTGRVWVKLDVQGYERCALDGAREHLDRVSGLQMEVSFVPLYDGAWSWREALAWADGHGFSPVGVQRGFTDQATGQVLQADFVFAR